MEPARQALQHPGGHRGHPAGNSSGMPVDARCAWTAQSASYRQRPLHSIWAPCPTDSAAMPSCSGHLVIGRTAQDMHTSGRRVLLTLVQSGATRLRWRSRAAISACQLACVQ
jgi:hypothetical protein